MTDTALSLASHDHLNGLSEQEMTAALKEHNPGVAPGAVREMAKIMTVVYRIIAAWPEERRRDIASADEPLRNALVHLAVSEASVARVYIERPSRTEVRQGGGLGETISVEEGRERLDRYAQVRSIESWAGQVAGAGAIEKELGIPRSTLASWYKKGLIVGLLKGERKLLYPIEQFVDSRPIEGIRDVVRIVGDPRAAWLWLRQPHGALADRRPLSVLETVGGRERVVQTAERDFK